MDNNTIIKAQTEFFHKNLSGCAFAAYAACNPMKYGWKQLVLSAEQQIIDNEINRAILDPKCSTLSLIFPDVDSVASLVSFVAMLETCNLLFLGQDIIFEGCRCLGFRAKVDGLESWISGFGNFNFLPKTRQAPFTELAFRVKSRPNYNKVMKKAPENVIHLADMDMLGISDALFKNLWVSSLKKTAEITGKTPDLKSAAKTTFSVPEEIF